jgi:Tol biopolymer transport system component
VRPSIAFVLAASLAGASAVHADRLVDVRQVVRGDYLAPRIAPDGRSLVVTGPQLRGLYVAAVSGASVRRLTDADEAGIDARWTPDGAIAYRALVAGTRRDLAVDTATNRLRTLAVAAPVAFARNDRMYVERAGQLREIGTGDRFFGAVVSPDGDHVVFQGLVTGLHLYRRSTGTLRHIGPGTAPAWSPDGAQLAFEVTEDDGHDIVAAELYLYDVAGDRVSPLTATDRVIERRPSFGPDRTIAFDDNTGGIFVAKVVP